MVDINVFEKLYFIFCIKYICIYTIKIYPICQMYLYSIKEGMNTIVFRIQLIQNNKDYNAKRKLQNTIVVFRIQLMQNKYNTLQNKYKIQSSLLPLSILLASLLPLSISLASPTHPPLSLAFLSLLNMYLF